LVCELTCLGKTELYPWLYSSPYPWLPSNYRDDGTNNLQFYSFSTLFMLHAACFPLHRILCATTRSLLWLKCWKIQLPAHAAHTHTLQQQNNIYVFCILSLSHYIPLSLSLVLLFVLCRQMFCLC